MPPAHHISSTSRALYRVFVLPNLRTPSSSGIPIQFAPAFAPTYGPPSVPVPATPLNQTQVRCHRTSSRKHVRRHNLADDFVFDNAIDAPRVNFVDAKGRFFEDVATLDALNSFNRVTHHLVQVTPGKVDELGRPNPAHPPVCRVTSKIDLRLQHSKIIEAARKQERGISGPPQKRLELNWAIEGGDLKHRLNKLQEFLSEGRRVELQLSPKRRGRQATSEEADALLKAVMQTVEQCEAREVKKEGKVGAVLTMVFEGNESKTEKKTEKKAEKKSKTAQKDEESAEE